MADETYQPKVYKKQGGDELVIANGGEINVETGGIITANGTQASAVADLTDNSGGTANDTIEAVSGSGADAAINNNFADLAAKVNALIAALEGAGILAS
jgi:hypothetical protein